MAEERPPEQLRAVACRWRTSAETLDVIEALERIESLLLRMDSRLRAIEQAEPRRQEARR